MKRILFLLLIGLSSNLIFAQDIIVKTNGDEIKSKILEITSETIKYKEYEFQDGPIRNINISEVFMVIYENGEREMFKNKSVPQTIESQNQEMTIKKQNSIDETTSTNKNFGIRAGFFMPMNDAISEIYGNGISFGSDINIWSEKGFGGGISIEYFGKKGEPYLYQQGLQIEDADCKISIFPIYLTANYRIANNKEILPYFGAGIGIFLVNEKLNMTVYDPYSGVREYLSDKGSDVAFGFHLLTGIHIKFIYFEIKYSYGVIDASSGAGGSNCNIGGLTISGGLKF